jgi:hypothetical protein
MPRPQYPTKEGLWSQGTRPEESFSGVQLGTPYAEAVSNLRRALKDRDDFDPAVLFVWGTMQATAVLEMLKAAEEAFGEAGQEMARKAIQKAGYEAARGMLDNSQFPEGLDEIERITYVVTGINTILYASLERPWVSSPDRCEFDILWCPHQDRYTAFDCRVQRYFVEGMIQAIEEREGMKFTAAVDKLIPHGGDCCHFTIERCEDAAGQHPWNRYSDRLAQRALQKLTQGK